MRHFKKTIALCTVMFLACGSTAYAAPGAPNNATPAAQEQHNDGMLHNLDKIHAQLKLTTDQEQQWQATQAAMDSAGQQERAIFTQYHQQFQTLMQAPVLDLQALDTIREHVGDQLRQVHGQTQTVWLKWYNSLDLTQKTLVSTTLKAKWQQIKARAAK